MGENRKAEGTSAGEGWKLQEQETMKPELKGPLASVREELEETLKGVRRKAEGPMKGAKRKAKGMREQQPRQAKVQPLPPKT